MQGQPAGYRNAPWYWQRRHQNPFAPGSGTRDEQIRWVQRFLNRILNQNLPVDGVMSPATRTAVRNFQQRYGLPTTGYVGPDTQQALLATTAQQSPVSDGLGPSGDGAPDPTMDIGPQPPTDAQQATSDAELFEFFAQNEFSDNEFESSSDHENWESQLNSAGSHGCGHCNCHQTQSDLVARPSREFEFEWEEEGKPPQQIKFPPEQITADMCKYVETFTVDDYGPGTDKLTRSQQAVIKEIKNKIWKRFHSCDGIRMVNVRGHASAEGVIGRSRDMGLSRAEIVKDLIILHRGLRGLPIPTTSAGESEPIVSPAPTEREHRRNRRVEIIVS